MRIVSDISKNMSSPNEFWGEIQQETETKFWIPEFAYLNVIMGFRINFPTPFFSDLSNILKCNYNDLYGIFLLFFFPF